MITIKTNEDLKKMREAGRIVALTHEELKKHIVPGITTKELDSIAEKFIRKQGATPSFKGLYGFPLSLNCNLRVLSDFFIETIASVAPL